MLWRKAFEALRVSERMPVDVMPATNGEFFPPDPTPEQRAIMALQNAKGEEIRRKLGMSRREFVRSTAAYGVGFWAIGHVMGPQLGSYLTRADRENDPWQPSKTDACNLEFSEAQLNNLPGEFIFDVQSHHIDAAGTWRITNPGFHAAFAALWEQAGPLGGFPGYDSEKGELYGWGEGGEFDPMENLSRYHYIKELFLDSSTNMTVLSAVPSAPDLQNPLRISEAAETVGTVRGLAGTSRSVMHAFVMPNRGSAGTGSSSFADPLFMQEEFDFMEEVVTRWQDILCGWKVYTPWGDVPNASGWYLDDPVGQKFLAHVRYIGDKYGAPKVVACHKGFALPAFDARASSPRDVGPAAKANPDISIIVYHSGFDSERQTAYPGDDQVNSSDRGVNTFIKSLRENQYDATRFIPPGLQHGNVPNVYAETGAVLGPVLNDPDQMAHLLGKLIHYVGPRRVVYGTDSLWFGSPQPVISALRSFEFTQQARELYNLPHGLDGDRFDPTRDATKASSYLSAHPSLPDWPVDGKAHPERTIRNGIFGRNVAGVYGVDPDAQRGFIDCDEVQKIRDGYILNEGTPRELVPMATNMMPAARTRRQLLRLDAASPFGP